MQCLKISISDNKEISFTENVKKCLPLKSAITIITPQD